MDEDRWLNRAEYPFGDHFLELDEGRMHYVDEGEGPPVLLLHGTPTWSFLYRGIVIRLRKRFRCIAPDYPGFGLSEHPDGYRYTPREHAAAVGELVDHLGLDGLTVMGQDWGGPIGMRVAGDRIERIRGLVMGNTWYWPVHEAHIKAFAYVMSSAPLQWAITEKNFFVERMIPAGTLHDVAPEVMEQYRGPFPTAKSRAGVAELPCQLLDAEPWLRELADDVSRLMRNVPLLLVWGVRDFAFTPGMMDRFREDFALCTVRRLEARHFIQEDAPAEIAEAIGAFLDGPAGGGPRG